MKSNFFTIVFFALFSLTSKAKVTAKWLTVASVAIDDGKTRLLFDPSWTRPGLKHWLNLEPFLSDEALVEKVLKANDLSRVDAVFTSHSHFDHVVDAPMVSKLSGAIFYTDTSSERIARAYKDKKIRTIPLRAGEKIRIGDFLVTPIQRTHAAILHLFDFLPGEVPEGTKLHLWDYHVGSTWFYLLEHPDGNILIDQGSHAFVDNLKKYTEKVDVLIQGVANRKDDESILQGYLKSFSPKVFVPLHFDNFFFDFNKGMASDLPGVNLQSLLEKIKMSFPFLKPERPVYGNEIILLNNSSQ